VTSAPESHRAVVEAIDPVTRSIVRDASFEVDDMAGFCDLLDLDPSEFARGSEYEIEAADLDLLKERFGVALDGDSMIIRLRKWHATDGLPYKVHTGRELAMMLAGTKPLAVFSDVHPLEVDDDEIFLDSAFAPHVAAGRFVKREHIVPGKGRRPGIRRVLYALPAEQWRIDAYLLLWRTGERYGFGELFERLEGNLLGYEDWQTDAWIELSRRRMAQASAGSKPAASLSSDSTGVTPSG
jgi:hypothetical protein